MSYMDDQQFDRFFKSRLERLKNHEYPEKGWEHIENHLSQPVYPKGTPWQRYAMVAGIALLLLSNFFTLGMLSSQQKSMKALAAQLEELGVSVEKTRIDTVFVYSKEALAFNKIDSVFMDKRGLMDLQQPQPKKTPVLSLLDEKVIANKNEKTASSAEEDFRDSGLENKQVAVFESQGHENDVKENVLEKETKADSPSTLSDSKSRSSEKKWANQTITSHEQTPSQMASPDVGRKPRKALFQGWKSRYGVSFSIPKTRAQLGHNNQSHVSPAFRAEFLLPSHQLGISTGIGYYRLKYHSNDLHLSDPETMEHLSQFPHIQSHGHLNDLHEIRMKANVVDIPLALTYYFQGDSPLKPFIGLGLNSRVFLTQDFEYEFFTADRSDILEFEEHAGRTFSTGSGFLSLGVEYNGEGSLNGQLDFVLQQDFAKQGSEQTKYLQWGLRGTLWLK